MAQLAQQKGEIPSCVELKPRIFQKFFPEFAEAEKVADGEGIAIANYIVGNNFGNAIAEDRLPAEIEKVKVALKEAAELAEKESAVGIFGRSGISGLST